MSSLLRIFLPSTVGSENACIDNAARVSDAIEELQDLDGAFAPHPNGISIPSRLEWAMLRHQATQNHRQFPYAIAVVKEIVHDL
jgi:hypothetical protein